jgi:hypothetical protein
MFTEPAIEACKASDEYYAEFDHGLATSKYFLLMDLAKKHRNSSKVAMDIPHALSVVFQVDNNLFF